MRSREKDVKKASKLLEKDIKNSVNHIFGDHQQISVKQSQTVLSKLMVNRSLELMMMMKMIMTF